ncbi:MAG: hypothetical protein D6B28_08585 [Gammaproteobacteria bacterium]|nr:MAG: hypothetical protein D6B28_08585 [Gammaproteobacteria bacterium]
MTDNSQTNNKQTHDLTRWNRAGLVRFQYVDGNAATYLEKIRQGLADKFPQWEGVQHDSSNETESETKARIESQYNTPTKDMLFEVSRSFARGCHVLTEHINAYANEKYIGTATQWDSMRRLVAMLDYYPAPPASATTDIALLVKDGKSGTVEKGVQFKYAPEDGSSPKTYETIEKIEVDSQLNILRAIGYNKNPERLSGREIVVKGEYKKLKIGEPIIIESTLSHHAGKTQALLISSVKVEEEKTTIGLGGDISKSFRKGYTIIHFMPKEKLQALGPISESTQVDKTLHLKDEPTDLVSGEIVAVYDGRNHSYRSVKDVNENRVTFHTPVGHIDHKNSKLIATVALPIVRYAKRPVKKNKSYIMVVYAAGDWSYLANKWVCDTRIHNSKNVLVHYNVSAAKYTPIGAETDEDTAEPGFTALTIVWNPEHDMVKATTGSLTSLKIRNPQVLNVPNRADSSWDVDPFLSKSNNGSLVNTIKTSEPKQIASGDIAAIVRGAQVAWGKIEKAQINPDEEAAYLTAQDRWYDHGGGPFFLSQTNVFTTFKEQASLIDATENHTSIAGKKIALEELPASLQLGRKVIIEANGATLLTTVKDISNNVITLAENITGGFEVGNTSIYANVVTISHGAVKPEIVLGSGDATIANQSFEVNAKEVSFVPDSSMSTGVRADIDVLIDNQRWTQVSNLKDSDSVDIHYAVKMTESGNIKIEFGDGTNGRRIPTGKNNVRLNFRKGVGEGGNIPAQMIVKPAKMHPLLEKVYQPSATYGGHQMESADDMGKNAPGAVLSLERAVSLDDFSKLARTHSSVSQASSFMTTLSKSRRECIDVVVVPVGGTGLEFVRGQIKEFLQKRAVPGVLIKISEYQPVIVSIDITIRADLNRYSPEMITNEVKQKIAEEFSINKRELGQSLHRGEIYKVVENIEGVTNSDCVIEIEQVPTNSQMPKIIKGSDDVIRMVQPSPRQLVHLDNSSPKVTVAIEDYRV